jgi:hypothetical protein
VLDLAADDDGLRLTLRLTHPAAVRPDVLAEHLLGPQAPGDPRRLDVTREALLIALPARWITPLEAVATARPAASGYAVEEGWGS